MVEKRLYGKLHDGTEVYEYILKNSKGAEARLITYGATVTLLKVPDRNGVLSDVVFGYDSLQGYLEDKSFFGVTVGRYGNRINKGSFVLDGKKYQLTINDGENHLHGGHKGFSKVVWNATIVDDTAGPSVAMTYVSPDGDEGYPGTVTIKVTFTLTNDNALRIVYEGTTDKPTVLNPTHHSYFNLSGSFTKPITDHIMKIDADSITEIDQRLIPTGKLVSVENTPFDFRKPVLIGSRINEQHQQLLYGRGYDHNWVLKNYNGTVRKVVEVYEPTSGRVLEVWTDQPGIQFYAGNFLNGTAKGKGVAYEHRTGFCLEPQCFPDSPNHPHFPSTVLRPGQIYKQTTIYKFTTRE
ncbi:MAG: galactose mutarotase [Bacteroidetes bacterium]|nr:galactose mutarotase [Bacteroidota bacterium]